MYNTKPIAKINKVGSIQFFACRFTFIMRQSTHFIKFPV